MSRLSQNVLIVLFLGTVGAGMYVFGGCATAARPSTAAAKQKEPPNNTFSTDKDFDAAWSALAQAMRKHELDANKDTGIMRTEKMVAASDIYNAGMGRACEVYSWVITVSKSAPTKVIVERDVDVYDAAHGSVVCNEILSQAKTQIYMGSGITTTAQAQKTINNPQTSYRLENKGAWYLKNALLGGSANGRMPVLEVDESADWE